ncbi:SH3 domain-containing protein [Collimonas arenae]|nr:hypothetical protein [Collimonas arenae]
MSVTVAGCINGYTWCDVYLPDGNRGWVYAQNLNYPYQGSQVPLMSYGSAIGLPIVAFTIGAYWGQYYRGRPWYRNQAHWSHIRPGFGGGHRPGVRPPPGHGARPPIGVRPPGGGHTRPPGGGHVRPPGGGKPPGGGHVRPPNGGNHGGGRPHGGARPQPR